MVHLIRLFVGFLHITVASCATIERRHIRRRPMAVPFSMLLLCRVTLIWFAVCATLAQRSFRRLRMAALRYLLGIHITEGAYFTEERQDLVMPGVNIN